MESKYLGITPYEEEQQFDFVGREDETWALYDRIKRNDYTVYYAASGEGKSSLIRAGLLPILRRREYYPIYIVLNDNEIKDRSLIADIIDKRINDEENKWRNTYEEKCRNPRPSRHQHHRGPRARHEQDAPHRREKGHRGSHHHRG